MSWIRPIGHFIGRIRFWLSAPLRYLMSDKSRLAASRPSIVRQITRPFLWLVAVLLYGIANIGELIISWSRSRPARALMLGLPALAAIIGFVFIVGYLYNIRQGRLINTYLLNATRAERIERFDTARMYYQKLLQLDPDNQGYDYQIAKSFDAEGRSDEALRRMSKLLISSPDIRGSVNYWFAEKTMEREDIDDKTKWIAARQYVSRFLDGSPRHYSANRLARQICMNLGNLYLNAKQEKNALDTFLEAEGYAKTLSQLDPKLLLDLARIQTQIANLYGQSTFNPQADVYRGMAFDTATESIEHFQKQVDNDPNMENLLFLSDSFLFLKKYNEALKSLDVAIRNDLSGKLAPKLIAHKSTILSAWAKDRLNEGTDNLARSMELIDQAIRLDPRNENALGLLAQISVMNNDEVSLAAKQKLDKSLADSAAPFSVHMILGSYSASKGEDDVAVRHLRQALLINRTAPAVMNNLAFVLARLKEPRFNEALSLINNALKLLPENPRFLDTRGNVYMQMKQYELAFHDLEMAEIKIKDNVTLYENLVFLAEKLGFDQHYAKYNARLNYLKSLSGQATKR